MGGRHKPKMLPLACGHEVDLEPSLWPQPGEWYWCWKCDNYTHRPFPLERDSNDFPILGEWRWACLNDRRCNRGQHRHGDSEMNARYAGSRHSIKRPTHQVWLISPTGVVVERWGDDGVAEPLFRTSTGLAFWSEKALDEYKQRERVGRR